MNQSGRGATHLHQQLPLDLLRAGARETHVAGGVRYMRLRAYGRRERDTSAPILCLWHGPIWSVLFDPCCYHPQQHQHRLAADGSLRDLKHPAITA